jgi:hypothetical protein
VPIFQAEPLPSFTGQTLSVTSARTGRATPEVVEHEQADGGRQIALLAVRVNFANQLG